MEALRYISFYFRFLYATVTDSAALCCEWTEVHHDSEFSGYSIMTVLQCQQLLALGNLHGYIKLLKLNNRGTNIKLSQVVDICIVFFCLFVCFF